MKSLPTLRRKIFSSFSFVVALYAVLGFLLVLSVNIASGTTPKLLHVNYDSIAAAFRMNEAWNALQFKDYSAHRAPQEWVNQFETAIQFEEKNITEPGEKEIAQKIRKDWESSKSKLGHLAAPEFEGMHASLDQLIAVNERGMFGLAQGNERLSRRVMIGTLIYFFLSLCVCLFFADNLAQRLSRPLKSIAEALHARHGFTRRLKLPEATNLELLILTTELQRLWTRLSESEKVNVAELLEQKSKLETLLESVEDALLVLSYDGTVSHCNAFLVSVVGLPKEEIQGKRWDDLPTNSENYLQLRATLRPGMPESQQVDLHGKNGLVYFSARSRKIETGDQGRSGILYLLHNITEKKQREKFRAEFIDLLSHELKTPLQSLGTASELLTAQKKSFSPDLQLMIETVAEDVQRIRAVSQEFVQITQSQSKIMKLKLELVAINQVLPEWLKPFQVVAKDRNIKINYQADSSDAVWANLDLIKFPWVISNILSNAIRFSPTGETVTVTLREDGEWTEIQISDLGPGIPEEEQSRMFEPFYQTPMATASGTRGLFGIGLTIAKEVVEAHDGRIEYKRLEPHGSVFKIVLPVPNAQYAKVETKA